MNKQYSPNNRRGYGNRRGNKSNFKVGSPSSNSKGHNRGYHNKSRKPSRSFGGTKINPERYIAKAQKQEEVAAYIPENKFENLKISEVLKRNISEKGFVNPTKIQDKAIPAILEGRDVIGLARTGTGKTSAFLIPLINKAMPSIIEKVLIIVPTRELTQQIEQELKELTKNTRLTSAVIIGGISSRRQINDLRRMPQFVIGTPGRIKDLAERKELTLRQFNNIVLDEVDRMLDMGFVNDIKNLIAQVSHNRQSLFFSATTSREVENIAAGLLKNPVKIDVSEKEAHKNVEQSIIRTSSMTDKINKLHDILIKDQCDTVLVFTRTKRAADRLSKELVSRGFKADSIHGDKNQSRRSRVIDNFKKSAINVLVATDVAARGIDVPGITHVINFDEPANYDDYTHRIGRTGRAGKTGAAITFVG